MNHRFSAKLDYKIDDKNSLIWRPKFTWQNNQGEETIFGQTLLANEVLNQTNNDFNADLSALNLSNDLLWKHKFNKRRRTLSLSVSSGYAPQKGESYLLSENIFGDEIPSTSLLNQYNSLEQNQWNIGANVQYTEPIGNRSMLMLNYRASYQQEDSDKLVYDFEEDTQDYSATNESLSNVFSNDYFTQQLGGGIRYRSRSLILMAGANVQQAQLLNEQTFPTEKTTETTFLSVLPMAMLRYKFSKSENIRLSYRANTQQPSLVQLQEVIDNSNPLQLSIGNPNLGQSYQHRLFARYSKTNTEKSSVLYGFLGGTYTSNYIANSTYLSAGDYPLLTSDEVEKSAQLTVPVNINGNWSVRSLLTYGFPVKVIKSNLNIDLSANYSQQPGLVNEKLNYSKTTTPGIGLTLSSNISDKVDFTLSSRSNYNIASNTLQIASNTNYFNQNSRLKFNWILGDGFVFRTDLTHQFYDGLSDDFDQNYLLWNMSIGKKIFKNNRGEISLTAFDILKQNNSLTRNVTETYIEDVQSNVLQQYFMLNFKYDLRHFKAS